METSSSAVVGRDRANEILAEASALLVEHPCLRFGQAIVNVSTDDDWHCAWPELFNEECPVKASEIFYSIVYNGGKRELRSSLTAGLYPLNRA